MSNRLALNYCHLGLLAMIVLAIMALGDELQPEGQTTLRILSYNIKHGYGMDGKVDLSRSAQLIRKLNPDLVALQEIDKLTERTRKVDQTKELGRMTEMHSEFGPFFDFQGGEYGMAILSKNKPSEVQNHRLPDGQEPRTALGITVVPIKGGPEIVFVGIHFYATQEERLAQAKRLLEILKTETRPVILAGDYNSRPDSDVMKLFADEWTIPDKGKDNLTIPSDEPRSEIDFIMFRNLDGWKVDMIDVLEEPLVSDHRPVLLELSKIVRPKSDSVEQSSRGFPTKSSADDPHPDLLRVMTYNTWYVFAKGEEQTAGKAFVNSQTPDVVGLQELTDIKPAKLQELASAWEHPHSSLLKTSGFSVGLTSRWPIKVVEKRVKDMHHGYLHAVTNGVHYFVVHLSPFKWEVRSTEAKIILKQVAGLLDAGNKVIVLGDFNAFTPDDRQWLLANKDLIPRMKESDQKHGHVENLKEGEIDYSVMKIFLDSGLSDTTERFISKSLKHRLTLPTGVWKDKETPPEKGQRIDFILASTNLFQRVKNSRIIREGAVNRISDHYPVITDFELD